LMIGCWAIADPIVKMVNKINNTCFIKPFSESENNF